MKRLAWSEIDNSGMQIVAETNSIEKKKHN